MGMDGQLMADTGYSRSPKLLKGALIQFSAPLLIPIPNVIVFQYNPETLTRTLTPWAPPERESAEGGAQPETEAQGLQQPFDPDENFTVALELDATDALEYPETHPIAVISGIADREAALEMLMYPPGEGLLSGLLGSVSASLSGGGTGGGAEADVVPSPQVPVVLFFWGPGRIVPVRITSFSIEQQAFSTLLYPIRSKVSLGMRVLTPAAFGDQDSAEVKIAIAAYQFTRAQKEVLATANLANSVESIVGMLPF